MISNCFRESSESLKSLKLDDVLENAYGASSFTEASRIFDEVPASYSSRLVVGPPGSGKTWFSWGIGSHTEFQNLKQPNKEPVATSVTKLEAQMRKSVLVEANVHDTFDVLSKISNTSIFIVNTTLKNYRVTFSNRAEHTCDPKWMRLLALTDRELCAHLTSQVVRMARSATGRGNQIIPVKIVGPRTFSHSGFFSIVN
jgi:hypothetical protein